MLAEIQNAAELHALPALGNVFDERRVIAPEGILGNASEVGGIRNRNAPLPGEPGRLSSGDVDCFEKWTLATIDRHIDAPTRGRRIDLRSIDYETGLMSRHQAQIDLNLGPTLGLPTNRDGC